MTNTTTYKNILNYPEYEVITEQIKILPRAISLDAEKIAKEMGNSKASNMVMLGAATPFIDIPLTSLENGIREIFGRKGEAIVELNLKALHAGREFAEANR